MQFRSLRLKALYYQAITDCPELNYQVRNMISKTKQGHEVVSKSGKPLSKPNLTKSQAQARLRQVEYYKSKNK